MRTATARGVETGLFRYATRHPAIGDDGRNRLDRGHVAFKRSMRADEIDMDAGFLIAPEALPEPTATTSTAGEDTTHPERGGTTTVREQSEADRHEKARDDLYAAWNALADLVNVASSVSVGVKATSDATYDETRIETGALEPLGELRLLHETEQ